MARKGSRAMMNADEFGVMMSPRPAPISCTQDLLITLPGTTTDNWLLSRSCAVALPSITVAAISSAPDKNVPRVVFDLMGESLPLIVSNQARLSNNSLRLERDGTYLKVRYASTHLRSICLITAGCPRPAARGDCRGTIFRRLRSFAVIDFMSWVDPTLAPLRCSSFAR